MKLLVDNVKMRLIHIFIKIKLRAIVCREIERLNGKLLSSLTEIASNRILKKTDLNNHFYTICFPRLNAVLDSI